MLKRIMTAVVLCLVIVGNLLAQGAPEPINAALKDLGTRLGRTITLTDPNLIWQWQQSSFADASLGCPVAGQTYAQVQTPGYIFNLTYSGVSYEYHVSSDQTIVVLCQNSAEATAVPTNPNTTPVPGATPVVDGEYTNPLCPLPKEGELPYMRTRMRVDIAARPTPGLANRLRETPGLTATQVGEIPAQAVFTIMAGPQCVDNIVWWQVDYDGKIGWTAEGQDGEYYLEPMPAAPLPPRQPITSVNAPLLKMLTSTQGNFTGDLTWASTGQTLALIGAIGSDSIWLYTPELAENQPTMFVHEGTGQLMDVDFMPTTEQIIYGTSTGEIHLMNLRANAPLREALFLKTHEKNTVVAVQPDGTHFVSGGENASTTANVDKRFALLYWDLATVVQASVIVGHTAPAIDLLFSPDGTKLASLDSNGVLLLTTLATPTTPKIFNQANYTAMAYSPNGQFVAASRTNGAIDLIDTTNANGTVIATYTGHLGRVNGLSFSPDSTLLTSVSDDGTLRLWSTQTDTQLAVVEVSEKGVQDVGFSPSGGLIVTATDDGTLTYFGVAQQQ